MVSASCFSIDKNPCVAMSCAADHTEDMDYTKMGYPAVACGTLWFKSCSLHFPCRFCQTNGASHVSSVVPWMNEGTWDHLRMLLTDGDIGDGF